jgi:thioredoxin 1
MTKAFGRIFWRERVKAAYIQGSGFHRYERKKMVQEIRTVEEFEREVLASDVPVLVDFWAPWCAPCRMLAPTLEELAQEYAGRIKVFKVNTDELPILAMQYGIRGIPTVILFVDGEPADVKVGLQPKAMFETAIARVLGE